MPRLTGLTTGAGNIAAAIVAVAYVIGFGSWWFWPQVNGTFHTVDVTITDTKVDVSTRDLVSRDRWSTPIAEFEGVALLNLGTARSTRKKFRWRAWC